MISRTVVFIGLWLLSAAAGAHTLSVSHLDIDVPATGNLVQVELDLSVRDIALTLPLDANRDDAVTWGEALAARESLEAFLLSGLTISSATGPCRLNVERLATRRYDDGAYLSFRMLADCGSRDALQVKYGLLFDADPQHRAIITMREGDAVTTAIARADRRTLRITVKNGSSAFFDFLREGVHHILIGYDHLAFLLSLLLPAALVWGAGTWRAGSDHRSAFRHVFGIVTAFTVAHSVTLGLAASGLVKPAMYWVEIAIAASVALAALNNIRPVVSKNLWAVAFVFGLIHGFGFAGALGELGLPPSGRLKALLGFNLGVELGQLLIVGIVLPVLLAVRNRRWYRQVAMPVLSIAIALVAGWWLLQRI